MFECHVCGNTSAEPALVSEVFSVDGRRVLVERIPADVCRRCGEAAFSAETAERIRLLVHGETQPTATLPLEVFQLA